MSERNPGVPIWSAHSIIAIRAIIILALLLPATVLAGDRIEHLVTTATSLSRTPLPPLNYIRKTCADVLCAARLIKTHLGPKARLEKITHPDTDTIRRVTSVPSLSDSKRLPPDTLQFSLDRFGRKAVSEIETVLSHASGNNKTLPSNITINLRNNRGGPLNRMLRVASLFLGPIPNAIKLSGADNEKMLAIPGNKQKLAFKTLKLIVGPNTASSAEIFAGLLRVHAKALIVGDQTFGKDYLLRMVPVNHDWRLLVPVEKISVPGTVIAGGIIPDESF